MIVDSYRQLMVFKSYNHCPIYNSSRKICYQKISELCSNFNNMSDKSKFYYLFTNLSIINIFGKCIIECLETRKLKQGLWYWNFFSLSVYINYFLRLWTRQETLYLYIYPVCIIASNDNNQCMQFVFPHCGPIDWNNKYSILFYSVTLVNYR